MYTQIITMGVIVITIVVLYIVVEVIKATETIDRISKKIENYFDRYNDISQSNTNTIKESIDEGLKGIHAEIKEIIRICNDIENSSSENINNYTEICDDIATINANITETKECVEEIKKKIGNKTIARKRIASGYAHTCKCKKDDAYDEYIPEKPKVPDPQIGIYNPQANKACDQKAE